MIKKETNAEYHASSPISKSRLFEMHKSPEWFKYCEENPKEQTEAMTFGSAFHKLVLEPDDFDNEFIVAPNCDRRTKAGKETYAAFLDEAGDKTVISEDMFVLANAMREKIMSNRFASALLSSGQAEMSYYTVDEMTGIEYKVRPDYVRMLGERGVIIDLKSTENADTESFVKQAINLGYDLQAAMFKNALEKITGIPHDFVFISVEKKPPYMINILQADSLMLRRGNELFREYIGTYAECSKTGNWYGYNGFSGAINNLSLPAWLIKEYE